MAAEAQRHEDTYNHELVQIMKDHDLIGPEEEEKQITTYLLIAQ